MIALITCRQSTDAHGFPLEVLESTYIEYLEKLNLRPIPASNFRSSPEKMLDDVACSLLVLTGGGSFPPRYYEQSHNDQLQEKRDETEASLIDGAIARGIPILGICRGMQYLNALLGGTISRLSPLPVPRPVATDHPVLLGKEQLVLFVNNFHNDGIFIHNLAQEFRPVAIDAENAVVEAFASSRNKILALQWHPERPFSNPESARTCDVLIHNFIANGGVLNESYYIGGRTGNTLEEIHRKPSQRHAPLSGKDDH